MPKKISVFLLIIFFAGSAWAEREGPEILAVFNTLLQDVPSEKLPGFHRALAAFPTAGEQERRDIVIDVLENTRFDIHKADIIDVLVQWTGIIPALPEKYRALVRDSAVYYFSTLPDRRLMNKIADQVVLDLSASKGQRLLVLINDMPTLQKIGQTVARNPSVDAEFRQHLIRLENSLKTDHAAFKNVLLDELGDRIEEHGIIVADRPLAAASVAQVIRFRIPRDRGEPLQGVFKTFKPGLREHLADEKVALKAVLDHFEKNRERYPLENFDLGRLLGELLSVLEKDIRYRIEIENLQQAQVSFNRTKGVHIPQRYPELCTENILAMEFIEGYKITDAHTDRTRLRRKLARKYLKHTVWHPLFEDGFFHADPHPGNVFFEPSADPAKGKLAFLDWSMAGRLTKVQRRALVQLSMGIELKKMKKIMKALQILAENDLEKDIDREALQQDIRQILRDEDRSAHPPKQDGALPPKTTINRVMERALARGVVFQQEILLFQKMMMTVNSVTYDLDPGIRVDDFKSRLARRVLVELPKRIVLLPRPGSRNYKSMVSNGELFSLVGKKTSGLFH